MVFFLRSCLIFRARQEFGQLSCKDFQTLNNICLIISHVIPRTAAPACQARQNIPCSVFLT